MVFTLAVKSFENQKIESSIVFMPQSGMCVNPAACRFEDPLFKQSN
jgi:hypothetical protein